MRDQAILVIDSGTDLNRWHDAKLTGQRAGVLAKTRILLLSPQPAPKTIPRRERSATAFVPGDVFAYQHASGHRFLFWVSRNRSDKGGDYNDAELLEFVGPNLPRLNDAVRFATMQQRYDPRPDRTVHAPEPTGVVLIHAARIRPERVVLLGNHSRPPSRGRHLLHVVDARKLDDYLEPFLPGGDHVVRQRRQGVATPRKLAAKPDLKPMANEPPQ